MWIFGSSIIRDAFIAARGSYGGSNLDLGRHGLSLWWQGKSGLRVRDVKNKIRTLLKVENAPDIIILHCGGNDIGQIKSYELRNQLSSILQFLHKCFPYARIIWSQILPRLKYRNENNHLALEKVRKRINSYMACLVIGTGGCYIKYPEINEQNTGFFKKDDVHLNQLGNQILLYRIQQALQRFVSSNSVISPSTGEFGAWLVHT